MTPETKPPTCSNCNHWFRIPRRNCEGERMGQCKGLCIKSGEWVSVSEDWDARDLEIFEPREELKR